MNELHVLNLVSWYPDKKTDVRGAFFRQRIINNAKKNCRMGVIFVKPNPIYKNFKRQTAIASRTVEIDDGLATYRASFDNWAPRIWSLIESKYVSYGLDIFQQYIDEQGLPDIIHVYSAWPAGFLALEIFKRYGIPYVLSEHSSMFLMNRASDRYRVMRLNNVFNFSKGRYAVSSALAECMEVKYQKERGFWSVVPNPVNPKYLSEQISWQPRGGFVFGHLSLLNRNKNVALIVRAFASAFDNNSEVTLTIAGKGPELDALIRLAENLGVARRVRFLGLLNADEIIKFFQSINVLVHASRFETFGNVLAEAMAMGVPVVSTRCGGPNEIITDECGLLVEEGSLTELTKAMVSVATNKVSWDRQRIRDLCETRFSPMNISSKWREIYDDACAL